MAVPETAGARIARRLPHLSGPVKLVVRIVISAALLVLLITKIPADDIQPRNTHFGTLAFLAGGLIFTLVGFVLSAWRWQRVLAVFDTHVPLRSLVGHYLAGQFVGNVLPSTVGGDVLRVSRISKSTKTTDIAFASVVLERLSGMVSLPLLTCVGFLLEPSLRDVPQAWIALAIAAGTFGALLAILAIAGSPKLAGRFASHQNLMRFVGAVHVGVDRLRRDPRRAGVVLFAAIVYQTAVLISVWCAIHALGVSLPTGAVIAFLPAVAAAQTLPISLSGLGIREGLLVLLLHPLGVPTGKAVGIGLLWYGMTLVVSLLGAPAFAIGNRPVAAHDPSAGSGTEDGRESGNDSARDSKRASGIAAPAARP
jgi:glycosyltransferase 2 family protein